MQLRDKLREDMQIRNRSEITMGTPCVIERILTPKRAKTLPDVMSLAEVLTLLEAVESYRNRVTLTVMSLDADRFISRFLLHVLPRGYTRIRHYGLTAPGNIKTHIPLAWTRTREAGVFAKPEPDADRDPPPDPHLCPTCGGRMLVVQTFDPVRRDPFDTS